MPKIEVARVEVITRTTDYDMEEYTYIVDGEEIFSYGDPNYEMDADDMLASILHLLRSLGVEYKIL